MGKLSFNKRCQFQIDVSTVSIGFQLYFRTHDCNPKRRQSTPAINHAHCGCVNTMPPSPERCQTNRPRCKRRWHSHTPVPSHSNTLMRLPARLQNTNAEPEHGERCNACSTNTGNPSIPRRMSTGSTISQIFPGFAIKDTSATPPANAAIPSTAVPAHDCSFRGDAAYSPMQASA